MRVLIIGAGALGLSVGASLSSQGIGVDFIARGETKAAIDREGYSRTGLFWEIAIPAGKSKTYDDYRELPDAAYDFIIVTAKTTANRAIARELYSYSGCMRLGSKIVLMQNGWGGDEQFVCRFDEGQICAARVITGFRRTAPNVSDITVHTAPVLFGSLYTKEVSCLEPLAKALSDSNLPAEVTSDISKALWAKMLYNCTLNPLGAILRTSYGEMSSRPTSRAIMDELMRETFEVMTAAGYSAYQDTLEEYRELFYSKLIPDTYNHRASTLQDVEAKRRTEIDTLSGAVIKLAKRYKVAVPTTEMIYRLVKAIEEGF